MCKIPNMSSNVLWHARYYLIAKKIDIEIVIIMEWFLT